MTETKIFRSDAACRDLFSRINLNVMNAARALKLEIESTPEPLLQEVYDFLIFLKTRTNGSEIHFSEVPPCANNA